MTRSARLWCGFLVMLYGLGSIGCGPHSTGPKGEVIHAQANRLIELSFVAAAKHADPFNDVVLDVDFFTPDQQRLRVPAFWAGNDVWKVRFSSPVVGLHTYRTLCSNDAGLHNRTGTIDIASYTGDHPLYRHGFVKIAGDNRHLEYADGTPFFWLAD